MDEDQEAKEAYFTEFVKSQNVRSEWKDKLLNISSSFANNSLKSNLTFSKFSQSFNIHSCEDGNIEDSFFLKGALIESGIVNCQLSKISAHPCVIIVKKCMPDGIEVDAQMSSEITETILNLDISIVLCLDVIPAPLVAKFVLKNITAIQKVSPAQVAFIKSFSGLPIIESFASIYASIPRSFYGFFYVSIYGFEPEDVDGIVLTEDMKRMIRNGYKTKTANPVAYFVHNNQFSIGSFILYGCTEEETKVVPSILNKLLDVEFNNYCSQRFLRAFGILHYVEDPFTSNFPFSLIHFSSPDFSVCTPYINDSYTENDLSLRKFFLQAAGGTPDSEPIFDYVVEESCFDLEKNIAFRLLHGKSSITFSTFQGKLLDSNNPPAVFWRGAYQPVLTDQFFEMSFTAFARFLFHCNELPSFGIILAGVGLFVEKSTSNVVYSLCGPIKPPENAPKQKTGAIARSSSEEELSSFRFFANVIHATEIVIFPSLSKCDPAKAGPYFLGLKKFVVEFGKKVASHSDWECSLRYQFFVQLFQWYSTLEQISPQLKNMKIPDIYMPFCTSTCRIIVIRLLLFSDFPHIDEVLSDIDSFDEENYEGVSAEWLLDEIEGKRPKKVTNNQYITSVKALVFASACDYFYPQIVILHSVNLNHSEPATIIAFALASDRFAAQVLNHCPNKLSEKIFDGKLTTDEFAMILSLPEQSQPFTLELDEKYPGPWPQQAPKVSVEVQCPVEFLALISTYGYTLESVVNILKTGHATVTVGGKSDAKYFETADHRFLIKTISQVEMSAMPTFLPNYFKYVCANTTTKIARVLGVFTIDVAGVYHYKCVLMENLRFGFDGNDTILYDFKGAKRNRYIDENEQAVQLDTNYEKSSLDNRLIMSFTDKQEAIKQINQDAHFLAGNNIMDYSLVVVLSRSEMTVRIGIVDIFRTYTLDKALETWVKKAAITSDTPTVISPDDYCHRFVKALNKYFYQSPTDDDAEAMRDFIRKKHSV